MSKKHIHKESMEPVIKYIHLSFLIHTSTQSSFSVLSTPVTLKCITKPFPTYALLRDLAKQVAVIAGYKSENITELSILSFNEISEENFYCLYPEKTPEPNHHLIVTV